MFLVFYKLKTKSTLNEILFWVYLCHAGKLEVDITAHDLSHRDIHGPEEWVGLWRFFLILCDLEVIFVILIADLFFILYLTTITNALT